ncbi:hypothetical protein Trydic_g925 [Trypoxylus dichotomus]
MRLITGAIRSAHTYWLPLLSNICPPAIRRSEASLKLGTKEPKVRLGSTASCMRTWHYSYWKISLQRNVLRLRNPPLRQAEQLDASTVDIRDVWDRS